MKKVRIIRSGLQTYWYANRIGEVFSVSDKLHYGDSYFCRNENGYIHLEDCVDVNSKYTINKIGRSKLEFKFL